MNTDDVVIMKASNGYVVSVNHSHEIYSTLDGVLERLLLHYEGLSSHFTEDSFGRVDILRGKDIPKLDLSKIEGIKEELNAIHG